MTTKKLSVEDRLDAIEAHLGLKDTNTDPVAVLEDGEQAAEPAPEAPTAEA